MQGGWIQSKKEGKYERKKYLPDVAFYRTDRFDLKKKDKYEGIPDLAFCRANRLDLKKKVSTNKKYLPDVAFVGWTIGSEKKGKYKRKILAFCI